MGEGAVAAFAVERILPGWVAKAIISPAHDLAGPRPTERLWELAANGLSRQASRNGQDPGISAPSASIRDQLYRLEIDIGVREARIDGREEFLPST
jgi:hypothetical protein